jgi:hypothetical protein
MKLVLHSPSLLSSAINYLQERSAVATVCCPGPKLWPSEVRTGSCSDRVSVLSNWTVVWTEGPVAIAPGIDLIAANSLSALRGDVSRTQTVLEFSRPYRIATLWRSVYADALSAVFIEGYNNAKPADGSATAADGFAKGADGSATTADGFARGANGSGTTADGFAKGADGSGTTADGSAKGPVAVATSGGGPAKPSVGAAEGCGAVSTSPVEVAKTRAGLRRGLSGLASLCHSRGDRCRTRDAYCRGCEDRWRVCNWRCQRCECYWKNRNDNCCSRKCDG